MTTATLTATLEKAGRYTAEYFELEKEYELCAEKQLVWPIFSFWMLTDENCGSINAIQSSKDREAFSTIAQDLITVKKTVEWADILQVKARGKQIATPALGVETFKAGWALLSAAYAWLVLWGQKQRGYSIEKTIEQRIYAALFSALSAQSHEVGNPFEKTEYEQNKIEYYQKNIKNTLFNILVNPADYIVHRDRHLLNSF